MKTKRCTKCHAVKPMDDFRKYKKDVKRALCRNCENKYRRERRANDPEYRGRINKQEREYRRKANNPEYCKRTNKYRRERRANDQEYRDRLNKYYRERYANDPEYRARVKKQSCMYKRHAIANDTEFYKKKRLQANEYIEKLKTAYVRQIINKKYKIPYANINNDMIERERDLIKINRLFRRKSNAGTKKIN